jgi:hypothetical protein
MKRSFKLITVTCLLITVLSACGAPALVEPARVPTSAVVELASPTAPATETPSPLPPPSQTPAPTLGPTATETALPTLELPPLELVEPALDVWDGRPTYIADSLPGYYFRVKFNPSLWGLTQDSYGQPALGHRNIEYCILAPGGVRGMPPGTQVEHDTRQIGKLFFEINTVLISGQRQFVTYQASDKTIFTSFQVNFVAEIDACLKDAEAVLATLTSVPEWQATPAP